MARLEVASVCGSSRVSRADGEQLRHAMEARWAAEEPTVIDFAGVVIASVSFFDESFGLLALAHPTVELGRRFRVENIGAPDRNLLNSIVSARARERAAAERASA